MLHVAAARARVLLVGDYEEFAHLAEALRATWDVILTTSAFGTVALARETKPAAIVLDLRLPFRSGVSLLLRLRADAVLRRLPVILLSPDPAGLPVAFTAMADATRPLPPHPPATADLLAKLCLRAAPAAAP
jgi:CheY-like chemotaxis protein